MQPTPPFGKVSAFPFHTFWCNLLSALWFQLYSYLSPVFVLLSGSCLIAPDGFGKIGNYRALPVLVTCRTAGYASMHARRFCSKGIYRE